MGGILRLAAVRDEPDHVEVVEGPDGAERGGRQEHRLEERQRDVPELLPAARPVDPGGLVEFLRNPLQAAEGDHHHEWKAEPHVGNDAGLERPQRLAEPVDRRQAEPFAQHQVHGAVLIVEHAPPGERCDVGGHGPGNDQQQAVDRLAADRAVEGHGEHHAQGHVQRHVDHRPEDCLQEHPRQPPELRIREHFGVVLQAHDPPVAKPHQRHVGQREHEVPDERKHDHGEDHRHGGKREGIGGGVAAKIREEGEERGQLSHEEGEQAETHDGREHGHQRAGLDPAVHRVDEALSVVLHPLGRGGRLERPAEHRLVGRPHAVPHRPELRRHRHKPAVFELGPRGGERGIGGKHGIVPDGLSGGQHPQPLHEPPLHVVRRHVSHEAHRGLRRGAAGVGVERVALRSHHRSHG